MQAEWNRLVNGLKTGALTGAERRMAKKFAQGDFVEIDELLIAKQIVNFVLTRSV